MICFKDLITWEIKAISNDPKRVHKYFFYKCIVLIQC